MRQRAGGSAGGSSTVGYPSSTSLPLEASPTYGDHRPITADESPPLLYPSFLVLIIGLDIHIIDVGRIGTRR